MLVHARNLVFFTNLVLSGMCRLDVRCQILSHLQHFEFWPICLFILVHLAICQNVCILSSYLVRYDFHLPPLPPPCIEPWFNPPPPHILPLSNPLTLTSSNPLQIIFMLIHLHPSLWYVNDLIPMCTYTVQYLRSVQYVYCICPPLDSEREESSKKLETWTALVLTSFHLPSLSGIQSYCISTGRSIIP